MALPPGAQREEDRRVADASAAMRARAAEVVFVRVLERCARVVCLPPQARPEDAHTEVTHLALDVEILKVHRSRCGLEVGARVEIGFARRRLLCPGSGYYNARDLQVGDEVWAFLEATGDRTYGLAAESGSFVDRLERWGSLRRW